MISSPAAHMATTIARRGVHVTHLRQLLTTTCVAALLLAACGGEKGENRLAPAYCADLRDGMTPGQIYAGARQQYPDARKFAALAGGFAAIECPEQLDTNAGLRAYLSSWGYDPDTFEE